MLRLVSGFLLLFYTIIFRKKEIDFQNPSGRHGRAWQKKFVVTFSERMLYNSFQRISKFEYKIRHFAIMKKETLKQSYKEFASRACYSCLSNLFFFQVCEAEVLAIYLIDWRM